ncbi:MAG: UDP-3-O-(3-hydroxymyristoyl)glucosamine N-acyltransferase, partial [Desulfovibrionaceae bacterium]|nr:UDP-3-O-(3-hydroxymyristoyl)glucosamine N-acyltransferase [Desulfovibrionaceae bacterium]
MNIIDIVSFLGAKYNGPSLEITGINTLDEATPSQISFLANPKYLDLLQSTQAGAVLVTENHASLVANPIISLNP